jgi:hypothetical protein
VSRPGRPIAAVPPFRHGTVRGHDNPRSPPTGRARPPRSAGTGAVAVFCSACRRRSADARADGPRDPGQSVGWARGGRARTRSRDAVLQFSTAAPWRDLRRPRQSGPPADSSRGTAPEAAQVESSGARRIAGLGDRHSLPVWPSFDLPARHATCRCRGARENCASASVYPRQDFPILRRKTAGA